MKLDFQTLGEDLSAVPEVVGMAEAAGYDGYWTAETKHDPFLPHVLAAEHSERIELGTGIAVAFARTPMTVAHTAWDLQAQSGGRFILGLGSQIKPHIAMRFSMPWSKPAARMKEFVEALHAIWGSWETGDRLQFRGEFYTHALMTPFFNPGPIESGRPKVFIAAVGPLMIKVAGEVCDGLLAHGFSTVRYAEEVIVPTIEAALAASGRDRSQFELSQPVFVVTGADDAEMAASRAAVKQQIAFYGSTPAYRGVLEHHGWGDLQDELHAMSKRGEWRAMGDLIGDDILDAFAVVGEPYQAGAAIRQRYGHIADRVSFYTKPDGHGPEVMAKMIEGVRA
jgi:probable F420-dependent oxidoreductase